MTWEDRIKDAAYTSPGGNRLTFDFEDLEVGWTRKTTAYDFANVNGTYIQSRGVSGRRFPMLCYFAGDECDVEADGFETLLAEPGFGRLEHPLYGSFDVVPFGEITRRDDLKSAANQVVIQVDFWQSLIEIYPSAAKDLSGSVSASIDAFNAASAAQFERQIDLSGASDIVTFKDRVLSTLGSVQDKLRTIAKITEKANDQFNAVNDSINRGIDVLVHDPLTLAFQIKIGIQAPARANAAIRDRLKAYTNLAAEIYGRPDATTSDANLFLTREQFVGGYVSGLVVSVLNNQFETRGEALTAAASLLEQWDLYWAWRDANWAAIQALDTDAVPGASSLDTGEAYQALFDAVGLAAGYLVQISFTLKQERVIVLTRARTIIDLGFELYGQEFENKIDFFINSNEFTGSEILEIPRGRRVRYYV